MNVLNRLSIRARLYFGTVFSIALLVVVGGIGFMALDRTRVTLNGLFDNEVQTLTEVTAIRYAVGQLILNEKNILINSINSNEVAAQRVEWRKTLASLRTSLESLRKNRSEGSADREAIDSSLASIKLYDEGINPIFEKVERAEYDALIAGGYADRVKQHAKEQERETARASAAVKAMREVIGAVEQGNLRQRIDPTGSKGTYKELCEGVEPHDRRHRRAARGEITRVLVSGGRRRAARSGERRLSESTSMGFKQSVNRGPSVSSRCAIDSEASPPAVRRSPPATPT